eukprot:TRINITY_DN2735_c0_g1_i10.p1 TRINITY_DN2735_c0_g1~~TRINITY_DN2735_c0_g1_i10.p1  ORF type:complete len:205 (-),score=-12.00 TRINITY_DN2735_c0_g1_i10:892-1506(-)
MRKKVEKVEIVTYYEIFAQKVVSLIMNIRVPQQQRSQLNKQRKPCFKDCIQICYQSFKKDPWYFVKKIRLQEIGQGCKLSRISHINHENLKPNHISKLFADKYLKSTFTYFTPIFQTFCFSKIQVRSQIQKGFRYKSLYCNCIYLRSWHTYRQDTFLSYKHVLQKGFQKNYLVCYITQVECNTTKQFLFPLTSVSAFQCKVQEI